MMAVAFLNVNDLLSCTRYVARGISAPIAGCGSRTIESTGISRISPTSATPGMGELDCFRSASNDTSLQQPGDAPRCELVLGHRCANVWMCSVDQTACSTSHQPGGLVCQVGYQAQHRTFRERPVDCKGSTCLKLAAAPESDLGNQWDNVALAYGKQALVQIEPVLVSRIGEFTPVQ